AASAWAWTSRWVRSTAPSSTSRAPRWLLGTHSPQPVAASSPPPRSCSRKTAAAEHWSRSVLQVARASSLSSSANLASFDSEVKGAPRRRIILARGAPLACSDDEREQWLLLYDATQVGLVHDRVIVLPRGGHPVQILIDLVGEHERAVEVAELSARDHGRRRAPRALRCGGLAEHHALRRLVEC